MDFLTPSKSILFPMIINSQLYKKPYMLCIFTVFTWSYFISAVNLENSGGGSCKDHNGRERRVGINYTQSLQRARFAQFWSNSDLLASTFWFSLQKCRIAKTAEHNENQCFENPNWQGDEVWPGEYRECSCCQPYTGEEVVFQVASWVVVVVVITPGLPSWKLRYFRYYYCRLANARLGSKSAENAFLLSKSRRPM